MATIEIIITPSADADINNIVEFISETRSPEFAIRFVRAFYKQLDMLESAPAIGTPSRKKTGVRRVRVDKYMPYTREL